MKDLYVVLGVSRSASMPEIRTRFRDIARDHHPDRFQGVDKLRAERDFQEITEAFNVLTDLDRRRRHDQDLLQGAKAEDQLRAVQSWLQRANAAYRDRRFAEALDCFERAIDLDASSADAWQGLARVLAHADQELPRAAEAVRRAVELRPLDASALKLAGRLHALLGRTAEARRYYNEALHWGGQDPEIHGALQSLANTGSFAAVEGVRRSPR
jgi:curved DNA-binding protein CbpA